MKKVLSVVLMLVICFSLFSCSKKTEYYEGYDVPTFESVMGVKLAAKEFSDTLGSMMYLYDGDESDLTEYVDYLKNDFEVTSDTYELGVHVFILEKADGTAVITSYYASCEHPISVSPYTSSSN